MLSVSERKTHNIGTMIAAKKILDEVNQVPGKKILDDHDIAFQFDFTNSIVNVCVFLHGDENVDYETVIYITGNDTARDIINKIWGAAWEMIVYAMHSVYLAS